LNSITTRKALSERRPIWGRQWWYDFREIAQVFDENAVSTQIKSLEKRYAALCRDWTESRNSEWICRIYLSAKMIMAATIQINSLEFAETANLRVVGPYLRYYAIFSLMRSIVFTLPEQQWNDGSLATLSHKKVLSLVFDYLRYFDSDWARGVLHSIMHLRHERELISYWHPSSGDGQLAAPKDIIRLATILSELAQFNSEILERAILKKADRKAFVFLDEYAERLSQAELVGHMHVDWDDAYRLDYLARKYPVPTNICHMITEGHVDDLMIGWCADEPDESKFDPDDGKLVIFDLP
jgi:hypothetical protein